MSFVAIYVAMECYLSLTKIASIIWKLKRLIFLTAYKKRIIFFKFYFSAIMFWVHSLGSITKIIAVPQDDCKMLAHPFLFPTGRFWYTHLRDVKFSLCKYFNQRLLNYTWKFPSDPNYIFDVQSVTQHLNLNSSINIAMKKLQLMGWQLEEYLKTSKKLLVD